MPKQACCWLFCQDIMAGYITLLSLLEAIILRPPVGIILFDSGAMSSHVEELLAIQCPHRELTRKEREEYLHEAEEAVLGYPSSYEYLTRPMHEMEWNMDRKGEDYMGFDLPTSDPALCEEACMKDQKCKAWTYLKPDTVQGERARCWLKHSIPSSVKNPNCVSGYKMSEIERDK